MPATIDAIWAWIAIEPDGSEGVPASSRLIPGWVMPMIGADEARIRSLQPEAEAICKAAGNGLKLMRFERGRL